MGDENNLSKPLPPDERQQAELRRAGDEKKREIAERAAQISALDGEKLKQQLDIKLIDDAQVRNSAIDEMAKGLAARGAQPGNFDWRDHRDIADEAIGKAQNQVAEEAKRRQAQKKELADHLRQEEQTKQAREQEESQAKQLAAQESRRDEPIPGSVQRFDGAIAESKTQKNALENAEGIERAAKLSVDRPDSARHSALKGSQEPSMAGGASSPENSSKKAKRKKRRAVKSHPLAPKNWRKSTAWSTPRTSAPARSIRGERPAAAVADGAISQPRVVRLGRAHSLELCLSFCG